MAGKLVEIHGAAFRNKGAELMLRTAVSKLREADGSVRTCMEADRDAPYDRRCELAMRQLFPTVSVFRVGSYPHAFRASAAVGKVLPANKLAPFGIVRRQDPDALIDLSGYAFGDLFPAAKCRNFAVRAGYYAKRRRPVLMLPQMLGPFEKADTREHFKALAGHATVLWARDRISYEAAESLLGRDERLRRAPDITIFADPPPAVAPVEGPYACIVPNVRMLDQGKSSWGEVYLPRMCHVVKRVAELGITPVVLVHSDGDGDDRLARQLVEESGVESACIASDANPLVLKGMISGARFLVGSRFHSIVAALSTSVPAVALGWAHKYQMLAEDFGVSDLLHNAPMGDDHLLGLVDMLADESQNARIRAGLVEAKESMREVNAEMWREVYRLIGLGASE